MTEQGTLDLTIVHGDDHVERLEFVDDDESPVSLAGRTYLAQIRPASAIASTGAPAATFTIDTAAAVDGVLVLKLSDAQTAALKVGTAYVWDLEETVDDVTSTLFAGSKVSVRQDVTRS